MTVVARTLASLTPEARTALHLTVEWAAEHEAVVWAADPVCRLGVLIRLLRLLGGTWDDVLALTALHDDDLDSFLNVWQAATVWGFAGDFYRIRPVEVA